jgi:putative flavoprotein involved in K+ transport
MMHTTVVVVGAGQAGLAMSHELTAKGIDHVVAERGEVANSWRTERWDSLRLLTPNWMTRLPGFRYGGSDPDGFMDVRETIAMLEAYRQRSGAPVLTSVEVHHARRGSRGFEVTTNAGRWTCDALVAATGAASEPHLPAVAAQLDGRITQLTALEYRNPAQLPAGEVLVVGASASGAQIADELRRDGRPVTLAVGEHVRVPRTYRGRDIHWWMDAIGLHDERYDEVDDVNRVRRLPSLQLVGSPERRSLDLNALVAAGVGIVGRLAAVSGRKALCSGGLGSLVAGADLKQDRLLARIDEFASERGLDGELPPPWRPERTRVGPVATELDLARFETVIWATGHRPRFAWLDPRAFDARGRLRHDGGVGALDGLYVLGLPFLRRRKSSFIDGVGLDAHDLARHLHASLDRRHAA